jgi:hypothetical protein
VETQEAISTSDGEDFVGPDGDVFVGVGTNFVFSRADVLQIEESGGQCTLAVDETLALGPEFATTFAYSRHHLENDLIPRLEELAAANPDSAKYHLGIENYTRMIARADASRNVARDERSAWIEDNIGSEDRLNLSFDAGAGYSASRTAGREEEFAWGVTAGATRAAFVEAEIDPGAELGVKFTETFDISFDWGRTTQVGTTVGFELVDDDQGDSYTVDVYKSKDKYDGYEDYLTTPVFDVIAGHSSCPYEPWMSPPLTADAIDLDVGRSAWQPRPSPRDVPKLRMNPATQLEVAPDADALFTLFMENQSATGEERDYVLRQLQVANPGGAVMNAGGNSLGELAVSIGGQQTQEMELAVERGPRRYRYDRLGLTLAPSCEPSRADTLYFDVAFRAPCSEIELFRPQADWTLNASDADVVDLVLGDFSLALNDQGEGVQEIGMEYRRAGTDDAWLPAFSASRQDVLDANPGTDPEGIDAFGFTWDFAEIYDGRFEYRSYSSCPTGRNYGVPVEGLVDRKAPQVLGKPSPSDRFLAVGDDIAITFDEAVSCDSVFASGANPNVTLSRTDTNARMAISAVCSGETVVIDLQNENGWPVLEGVELEARVEGLSDLAGNAMDEDAVWRFVVRKSAFGFALADVGVDVPLGQPGAFDVPLSNGRTSAVAFEVASLPEWLFASPMQGTLQPGASLDIAFQVAAFDTVGVVRDTVDVASAAGLIRLPVQTEVMCAPSDWIVNAADFQATMSLTAQVFVDGVALDDPRDQIAAFVGDEIRGLAQVAPQSGGNRASLLIYSNPDVSQMERVRFEIWDASTCRRYETTSKTLLFEEDATVGSPTQPVAIQAGDAPGSGLLALNAGWTWVSTNRSQSDMRVGTLFADLDAGVQDLVKSQTAFSVYDPSAGWVGSLASLAPGAGYLVYLGQSQGVAFAGTPVDPASTSISLDAGWNWIGYTPQSGQPIGDALSSVSASSGDVIKSQTAFAQYADGLGWTGSLNAIEPGQGYQIRVAQGQTFSFSEPAPSVAARSADAASSMDDQAAPRGPNARGEANEGTPKTPSLRRMPAQQNASAAASASLDWSVTPADYPYTQSVVARALISGEALASEDALVAAFAPDGSGGETCRGVARAQQVGEEWLFFLTVYGSTADGEELTLRLYDPATDAEVTALTTLTFVPDAVVGSVSDPFVVRDASSTSVETEVPEEFTLGAAYPNPFSQTTRLGYALPTAETVQLVLYDMLGRQVRILVDEVKPAGYHYADLDAHGLASGVYLYRIEAGAHEAVERVVLVK